MKKFIALLLTVVICFTSFAAFAAGDNIKVYLDGKQLTFDVEPQLISDRVMVPVRAIFEGLGANVQWNEENQKVVSSKESIIVTLTIGSYSMKVVDVSTGTEKEVKLDVAPVEINGRTLIPARFVAEAFGCDVQWDDATQSVLITSKVTVKNDTKTTVKNDTKTSTNNNSKTNTNNNSKTYSENEVKTSSHYGTRENPYACNEGATIEYNEYSFEPTRRVQIKCTNIISGTEANDLAQSENQFNDVPNSNQEYCFLEFDVKYVSSSDGSDDVLKASDIIYKDTFFKTDGGSAHVADFATLGDRYDGYGVFDVKLYPGGSGKVVIGLLLEKGYGNLLLRVPYNAGDNNSWILCNPSSSSRASGSKSSSSGSGTIASGSKSSSSGSGTIASSSGSGKSSFGGFNTTFNTVANGIKLNGTYDYKNNWYEYVCYEKYKNGVLNRTALIYAPDSEHIMFSTLTESGITIMNFGSSAAIATISLTSDDFKVTYSSVPYGTKWTVYEAPSAYYYGNIDSSARKTMNTFLDLFETTLNNEFDVSLTDMGMYIRF